MTTRRIDILSFALWLALSAAGGRAHAQDDARDLESESGSDDASASDSEVEPESTASEAPAPSDPAPSSEPLGFLTLGIAGGVTQRSIEITASDGLYKLNTGTVPAAALEWRAAIETGRARYAFAVHYETSLSAEGVQYPPMISSPPLTTPIRSHRLEVGVEPTLLFGEANTGVALGAFVGYGLRALASVAELEVPRFTLHGPMVRIELDIPIVPRVLRLNIAPEVSAIVSISQAVRRLGDTSSFGIAFGGEARLRLRVVPWLDVQLEYREAHALAQSSNTEPFRDLERFMLLGVRFLF